MTVLFFLTPVIFEQSMVPLLRIVMFDREYEAKLVCAGAVAIGADLAIEKKKDWAHQVAGRRRTLRMLEQAETFLGDWKQSESVRREEAALREEEARTTSPKSKKALLGPGQGPDAAADSLWTAAGFSKEVHKDLIEIQGLHRAFMRFALKEPTSEKPGLEDRFAKWLDADPAAKLTMLEKWLAEQRQSHYLHLAREGAKALGKMLWAGDVASAWAKVQAAVARIDASTDEYADEICEAIIAVASLVDIFFRMAIALGDATGLKKKIATDIKKRRDEREKKAAEPPPPGGKTAPTILGRLGAEAHDDKWAQDVLLDPAPSWGKQGAGLADGLSIVWSIDGGIGLGAGWLRPGMTPAATKLSKLSYRMTTNTHSAAPAENSEI